MKPQNHSTYLFKTTKLIQDEKFRDKKYLREASISSAYLSNDSAPFLYAIQHVN